MHNLPSSFAELLISQPCFMKSPFPQDGLIRFVDSKGYVKAWDTNQKRFYAHTEYATVKVSELGMIQRLIMELQEYYIQDVKQGLIPLSSVPSLFSLDSAFSILPQVAVKEEHTTTKHNEDCRMSFGRLDLSCPRCIELSQGAKRRDWIKPRY